MIKKSIFILAIFLFTTFSCSRQDATPTPTPTPVTCNASTLDSNKIKSGEIVHNIGKSKIDSTSTNTPYFISFYVLRRGALPNDEALVFNSLYTNANSIEYTALDALEDTTQGKAYLPYYIGNSGTRVFTDFSTISTVKNPDNSFTVKGCVKLYYNASTESKTFSINAVAK